MKSVGVGSLLVLAVIAVTAQESVPPAALPVLETAPPQTPVDAPQDLSLNPPAESSPAPIAPPAALLPSQPGTTNAASATPFPLSDIDPESIPIARSARALNAAKRMMFNTGAVGPKFVERALEKARVTITKMMSRAINLDFQALDKLAGTTFSQKSITGLVEDELPITKGDVYALVTSKQGVEIPMTSVRNGDIIQFWYTTRGKMEGHAAFVEEARTGNKLILFGCHPDEEGDGPVIGEKKVDLANVTKAYAVRLK